MLRWMFAIALALVTACGGGSSEPRSPHTPGGPPPTPTTEPPPPDPGTPPPGGSEECSGPPPGPGYQCVRDCGPPVAREGDPPPGHSWLSAEQAANRKQFGCPICLPDDARIATVNGDVAISELAPGALVWSSSSFHRRVLLRVEQVVSTQAPAGHRIVEIELADGRRVRASAGHPDAGGRALGTLGPGDLLDGSRVRRVTSSPYSRRTYDLVLEGGAARYVADGVQLKSSLSR